MDYRKILQSPEYSFLSTEPRLGDNLLFLVMGGSHAYGTNTPTSDIDVRGCAMQSASDLIGLSSFEQFQHKIGYPDVPPSTQERRCRSWRKPTSSGCTPQQSRKSSSVRPPAAAASSITRPWRPGRRPILPAAPSAATTA